MSKRVKYTDEPMDFEIVEDLLPPPEELRRRLRKVKVTVEVEAPLAAFRRKAGRGTDAYRRMMGELLDVYATRTLATRDR